MERKLSEIRMSKRNFWIYPIIFTIKRSKNTFYADTIRDDTRMSATPLGISVNKKFKDNITLLLELDRLF